MTTVICGANSKFSWRSRRWLSRWGYPGLAKVWHQRLGTFESVSSRVTDYDIAERHWAVMDLLDHIQQGSERFRERIKQIS